MISAGPSTEYIYGFHCDQIMLETYNVLFFDKSVLYPNCKFQISLQMKKKSTYRQFASFRIFLYHKPKCAKHSYLISQCPVRQYCIRSA